MQRQIAVIGEGDLSAAVTLMLALRSCADITVVQDGAGAVARDGAAAAALLGAEGGARVRAVPMLSQAPGAAVAVVTTSDAEELEALAPQIARHAPDAVVVAAGEPADVACAILLAETAFPRARVIGAAAGARQARLRAAVAQAAGVWPGDVHVDVLGGVGTRCVPLLSRAAIAGVPAADVLGAEALDALAARRAPARRRAGPHRRRGLRRRGRRARRPAPGGDLRRRLPRRARSRGSRHGGARPARAPGRRGLRRAADESREREALLRAAIRMR